MNKPSTCKGCPFYQDGKGFVPDEMVEGAEVVVLGQNPGEDEEKGIDLNGVACGPRPFIGRTGQDLMRQFLPCAGLERGKVSLANVIRCRWQNKNDLPRDSRTFEAIEHCRTHWHPPTSTKLVVACGEWAMQHVEGTRGLSVEDWRGFLVEPGVYVVMHPAALYRNPIMHLPSQLDWCKIPRILAGTWPEPIPARYVVDGGVDDYTHLWEFFSHVGSHLVIDTEYHSDGQHGGAIHLIGLWDGEHSGLQVRWQYDLEPEVRRYFLACLKATLHCKLVVFQNALADVPVMAACWGIKYEHYEHIDDTMLAHGVLWSDLPHTLEFLDSIYGKHNKLKHLAKSDNLLYNWGDVLSTEYAWRGMVDEFKRDSASRRVYEEQSLALVPLILKAYARGIKVNKDRVVPARKLYQEKVEQADRLAWAGLGWQINLDSPKQLVKYLYKDKGYKTQKKKGKITTNKDAVATLRATVGPVFDLQEDLTLAEALLRVERGADPVLEALVLHSEAAQIVSSYLNPLVREDGSVIERIYPNFAVHAQASGRWSTTEPPLAQLPHDLRDIIVPDDSYGWFGWDWDQLELRILAELSEDEPLLEAFRLGWDVHTLNACDIFALPYPSDRTDPHGSAADDAWRTRDVGWEGKDDIRRVFAKRFVYRLNYGGDPRGAGDIPGAKELGLTAPKLVLASVRYLNAHPGCAAWRRRTAQDALKTWVSRTFEGRRRVLLHNDKAAIRDAYDHPMQGGVSDIANKTAIRIHNEIPETWFAYQMHDSQYWSLPLGQFAALATRIKEIVLRPWRVAKRDVMFPATFKEIR